MNENLTYRAHAIELELMEIRPQRFRWLYVIDATHLCRSDEVLQPMQVARADALAMAFGKIDALEAIAATAARATEVPSATLALRSMPPEASVIATGRSEEARRLVARRNLQAERAGANGGPEWSRG